MCLLALLVARSHVIVRISVVAGLLVRTVVVSSAADRGRHGTAATTGGCRRRSCEIIH